MSQLYYDTPYEPCIEAFTVSTQGDVVVEVEPGSIQGATSPVAVFYAVAPGQIIKGQFTRFYTSYHKHQSTAAGLQRVEIEQPVKRNQKVKIVKKPIKL